MTRPGWGRTVGGVGLTLALLAGGCSLGTKSEREKQAQKLLACRGDTTDEELQQNILITEEYASGIAADLQLCWHLVRFIQSFATLWAQTLGVVASSRPVGWTFDAGTYRYGSDTAAIELRTFLPQDVTYGPAGTQVVEDIFSIDAFLVGAVFTADSSDGTVTATFDAPGPLAELLGLGAAPVSPLTLTAAQREQILASLSTLLLQADYLAYGVSRSTVIEYRASSPQRAMASIAEGFPLPLGIVEASASRDLFDQRLSTVEWDVVTRGKNVGGQTTFTVSGGYFPFRGRIEFKDGPLTIVAERDLSCP